VEACDLEETSFALIENRGEDAWRVELRKATPVDRTVYAHQRDRVQVADDAVGLDRLISHFDNRLSKSGIECGQGLILDIQAQNLNSKRSRRRSSVEAEEDWRCAHNRSRNVIKCHVVDGSELARTFFTPAGCAAMTSGSRFVTARLSPR